MSNVFSFIGTIGRDAEVRYAPLGMAILYVTVANNIGYGDKQTNWVRVVLFGKRAEGSLKDYLVKGQQVFVSGELSQSEYEAKDGSTKTVLELNANIINLIGSRREGEAKSAPAQSSASQAKPPAQPANGAPHADDFNDDIPF